MTPMIVKEREKMSHPKSNPNFSLKPSDEIRHSAIPKPGNSAKPGSSKQPNPNYRPPASTNKPNK